MNQAKPAHSAPARIGILGGTFNPVHIGHLKVAQEVRQQFGLDHILFIPCAFPPHKAEGGLASAMERLEMVRIAVRNRPGMMVSDIEIQRGGTSFTVDTLRGLKTECTASAAFYFLMGVDAFLEIHTWKSFLELLDLTALIVMTRPTRNKRNASLRSKVMAYAQQHISDQYAVSKDADILRHPSKKPIYLARVTPVAIASTLIRDMIRLGQPADDWVGPEVADYIETKGLYR